MRSFIWGYVLILLSLEALCAQDKSALSFLMQGDSLRRAYRFEEAIEQYHQASTASFDSLFRNRALLSMILCENGLNMLRYAADLTPLGSATIPIESFFLYLNTDPHSFWAIPSSEFFPEISEGYPAFVSTANKTIIFTGKQVGSHTLDLYISRQSDDSLWSYPVIMESTINSNGNECYPVLSTDGQTLWFASDGHYGMGGFDLYISHFDQESGLWSQARNMGFPYSSPDNDFAFMPAPDGLSALLVSDRGEAGLPFTSTHQHVNLYKVGHELNPQRQDWRYRPDVLSLALFQLDGHHQDAALPADEVEQPVLQNGLSDYTTLVQNAKKIRDNITAQERKLSGSREVYARLSQEEERLALEKQIEEEEMALLELREEYRLAGIEVQRVEMEFLSNGILSAIEPVPDSKTKDVVLQPFVPIQGQLGSIDRFEFAPPLVKEELIDISFRVEKQSIMILEETLPNYLFYRIQLAVTTAPGNVSAFKGISPIFEYRTAAGKYLYAAGLFSNYSEASKALLQVQRLGLRNAVIIAFNEGKSIVLSTARRLEATAPRAMYRISLGSYPRGLPETLTSTIKELSNKDIAIIPRSGAPKYVLGPFTTLDEAQSLQVTLTELGFEEIIIEVVPNI